MDQTERGGLQGKAEERHVECFSLIRSALTLLERSQTQTLWVQGTPGYSFI